MDVRWIIKKKVNVTIGSYVKNAEATEKETIKSLLYQDFRHELMELIVVDGLRVKGCVT